MKIPDLALGPEWALLELLCLGLTTPREQEMFEELMRSDCLHWGELLEQALRHKMLPMLAFHATSSKFRETVPRLVKEHLQSVLNLNRHKISILRNEAARIVGALDEHSVRFVGTKGIIFESTLYKGNGCRSLRDLDFMVDPKYNDVVISIMSQLGYQMGAFDWQTGKVRSHSREMRVIYQLSPDHIPEFCLLPNNPVVQYVAVDFATSLTWTRSPFNVPIEAALSEISYQLIPGYPDIRMPHFSPKIQFIFTILHLFREAWIEKWLIQENDVNLIKFADVVRIWRNHQSILNSKEFVQMLEQFQITDAVLWVLEHLDRTLHTGIVSALGLEGRVTESWLASAGASGGKQRTWTGTMRERLHCKDRQKLFGARPET
jgi:hypothetical protein